MVSVPVTLSDSRKASAFPSSISPAFAYDQGVGYVQKDTLKNGLGYWLKFATSERVTTAGVRRYVDTVDVKIGWNMIGTISNPALIDSVVQIPPGLVASRYYGYNGSYTNADTLKPGAGYWVKVNQNGKLVIR